MSEANANHSLGAEDPDAPVRDQPPDVPQSFDAEVLSPPARLRRMSRTALVQPAELLERRHERLELLFRYPSSRCSGLPG